MTIYCYNCIEASLNNLLQTCQWKRSSPTGPAEHWAGGSRPKSCSSLLMRFNAILPAIRIQPILTYYLWIMERKWSSMIRTSYYFHRSFSNISTGQNHEHLPNLTSNNLSKATVKIRRNTLTIQSHYLNRKKSFMKKI